MIEKLAEIRKLIVYVLGSAAELATMGLVPDPYAKYVHAAVLAATALGIYYAPNDEPGKHAE